MRMRREGLAVLIALLATGSGSRAGNGDLDVTSHTIDGGGGYSSGGGYSVIGSIAQPDADPLHPASGGDFTVIGGFIPGAITTSSQGNGVFADGFED